MDDFDILDDLDSIVVADREFSHYAKVDPLTDYSPLAFRERFRMSKESFAILLGKIRGDLSRPNNRGCPVSPEIQLAAALRFYATGSHQQVIGDTLGLSQATMSRILVRVSSAICKLSDEFIKFPTTPTKLQSVSRRYVEMLKERCPTAKPLTKIIGAIDGTHINVLAAGEENRERFRDRRSEISLNVQAICDADLIFTNLVARWHGSVHDSRIFGNSEVCRNFEVDGIDGYLLGDSGYPQRTYLMTPLSNPQTKAERDYNFSQIQCRNTIERAFGVLKRRWGCLGKTLSQDMVNVFGTVTACVILHNFLKMNGDEISDDIEIPTTKLSGGGGGEGSNAQRKAGFKARKDLIEKEFI